MSSSSDHIIRRLSGIVFLLFLFCSPVSFGQVNILDTEFSFSAGTVKTGNALNIISRETGFYFTYDSRLIDTEKKTEMSFTKTKLSAILDSLLKNNSLHYSVINKYIIIFKANPVAITTPAEPEWQIKDISGTITDSETGEPLSFAAIGIMSKGKGTVTNNNGEFGMKITRDCINDSLKVSYLGYFNRQIPVKQSGATGNTPESIFFYSPQLRNLSSRADGILQGSCNE
jgi:hypothetical protein